MDVCFRVLKERNKSRFDSYSVRNSVLIISHITFRDCRVHIFSDNLSRNSCIRHPSTDSRSIFRSTLGRELVDTPSTCRSILGWYVGRHLFYLIDLWSPLSVATRSISWSMTRRQVDHYVSVNRRCHIGDISVDYRPSHISADRVDMSVDKKALWSTAWNQRQDLDILK